jgi:hypothetical protein
MFAGKTTNCDLALPGLWSGPAALPSRPGKNSPCWKSSHHWKSRRAEERALRYFLLNAGKNLKTLLLGPSHFHCQVKGGRDVEAAAAVLAVYFINVPE